MCMFWTHTTTVVEEITDLYNIKTKACPDGRKYNTVQYKFNVFCEDICGIHYFLTAPFDMTFTPLSKSCHININSVKNKQT